MAEYSYKARTADGKIKAGIMQAEDHAGLIRQLKAQGLYCYQIKFASDRQKQYAPLKFKQLTILCRQLATMLHAGVTMSHALDIMYQSTTHKKLKASVLELYEGVQKGQALSVTMEQMGKTFPQLLIYMTQTGEASGSLDVIMEQMALHFEQEQQIKSKVQTAMIYPMILIVVSIASVTFMLTSVLPQFINMYNGVDLPAPTRLLLAISQFVKTKWMFLLGGLLGVVLLWSYGMTQKDFRIKVKHFILTMPVLGKLNRTVLTSRFASTFSILYGSGISILRCIEISSSVLANDYVQKQLEQVSEGLRRGEMLSACLEQADVFDKMFLSMVRTGEESGSLEDILQKTGEYFSREATAALSKMVALLEPAMIVILGVIIGFIVVSIILPIFNMYNQML